MPACLHAEDGIMAYLADLVSCEDGLHTSKHLKGCGNGKWGFQNIHYHLESVVSFCVVTIYETFPSFVKLRVFTNIQRARKHHWREKCPFCVC